MICDGLESISAAGNNYVMSNGKPAILLSWITFFSTVFGDDPDHAINSILLQVPEDGISQYPNSLEMEQAIENILTFGGVVL